MSEETWQKLSRIESMAKPDPNALIPGDVQIEGLDKDLWKKVSVVKGDLSPILQGNKNTIAMVLTADENGKIESTECIPAVGSTLTITYVDEAYFIDSRTGKPSDESTPAEYATYHIAKSHDVTYTIAAHVTVPNAMSHRYLSTATVWSCPWSRCAPTASKRSSPCSTCSIRRTKQLRRPQNATLPT